MSTKYCIQCGRHHPIEEMRLLVYKGTARWRCKASIKAAQKSEAERDAYGKSVTARNAQQESERRKSRKEY